MGLVSQSQSQGTGRNRFLSVVVALFAGVVVASLTIGLAFWGGTGNPSGPRTVMLGPYVLNNTTTNVVLTFPSCSFETVHWHVVTGSTGNFSVSRPIDSLNATCSHYVPPSNATCPPGGCLTQSRDVPVCYEQATGGSCTFTATYMPYSFGLYNQTFLESNGFLIVSFTVVYVTDPSGQ
jgi:hypothetical protein